MNRGRGGEERGGKETDGCPLTVTQTCRWNKSLLLGVKEDPLSWH
jgi:hypothetical protein